jgi:hypothetical protein
MTDNILPAVSFYKNNEPSTDELLERLHQNNFLNKYPNMKCFVTIQRNDPLVGGDVKKNARFISLLPNAMVISSSEENHLYEDKRQRKARNAYRKRHGASYFNNPEDLAEGEWWLKYVEKYQREMGIPTFIEWTGMPESYKANSKPYNLSADAR